MGERPLLSGEMTERQEEEEADGVEEDEEG